MTHTETREDVVTAVGAQPQGMPSERTREDGWVFTEKCDRIAATRTTFPGGQTVVKVRYAKGWRTARERLAASFTPIED